MDRKQLTRCALALFLTAIANPLEAAEPLGRFHAERDLLLAHFDSKTDVDDIHTVAALATVLADPRYAEVSCHAVAGAYGIQEGLYVPANDLFDMAFGDRWSDAHADRTAALDEVTPIAADALNGGGTVWIVEAGQSDFSAALVRKLQAKLPEIDLKRRVQIVQHANWNEEVTTPEDLAFVKQAATYHKIADGNAVGNGTPGFRSERVVDWRSRVTDPRLRAIWDRAVAIANRDNGAEGRYLNKAIRAGGLDFSDLAETAWVLGFDDVVDAEEFFDRVATGGSGLGRD